MPTRAVACRSSSRHRRDSFLRAAGLSSVVQTDWYQPSDRPTEGTIGLSHQTQQPLLLACWHAGRPNSSPLLLSGSVRSLATEERERGKLVLNGQKRRFSIDNRGMPLVVVGCSSFTTADTPRVSTIRARIQRRWSEERRKIIREEVLVRIVSRLHGADDPITRTDQLNDYYRPPPLGIVFSPDRLQGNVFTIACLLVVFGGRESHAEMSNSVEAS